MIRRLAYILLAVCLALSFAFPVFAGSFGQDFPVTELLPAESVEPTQPIEAEPETMFSSPYPLYFGLLHAHTDLSDGLGSVEEAFSFASEAEGLDFFAVTDHSNSFDDAGWAAGRAAAEAVTTQEFLGLFGYEMTWQETKRMGHIVTFGTDDFLSRDREDFSNPSIGLENYYRALTQLPDSVSMFCHPGEYFGDFHTFGHYRWEYDRQIPLLEVISGRDGSFYPAYTRALDAGWHVAPCANQNTHDGVWLDGSGVRTVVLAEALTRTSFLEALRQRRVYATEDADLHISFDLDGEIMGSILPRADRPEITLQAWDPTDSAIGVIEVITEGGTVLAREEAAEKDVFTVIPVDAGFRYYYIRITQPDGDVAVTAPVWVEGFENMGIRDFSADTAEPVQDQPVTLTISLYNEEPAEFSVDSVALYADGEPVCTMEEPRTVSPGETLDLSLSYTHPVSGEAELRAVVRGHVRDEIRSCEKTLTLRFRSGITATGILVDGSHNNAGLDQLERFCALAEEAGMDLTLVNGALPQGGEILLIPDPRLPFEDGFLRDVRDFAENGGDLILWGQGESLTPLLETLGITMRQGTQTLEAGTADIFRTADLLCKDLVPGQTFSHPAAAAVEPGQGQWIVRKDADGPVLLACEKTSWGGSVYLAGCPFLLDAHMPEQSTVWDYPKANETICRSLLGAKQEILALQSIAGARAGTDGEFYRIRGYVTAGTSNPHTTFPDTLYLQDESGGIAVTNFTAEGIQVGAPVEIIGKRAKEEGNIVLICENHRLLTQEYYRWVPGTVGCKTAGDYAASGGKLVQVEGRVTELTLTEDRKGICRLVLTDIRGDEAIIEIEEGIFSGATGENRLAKEIRKGRTVRAVGLVHINASGETVIRVRNCDEVVDVPPVTDLSNPDTGQRGWFYPIKRALQQLLQRVF